MNYRIILHSLFLSISFFFSAYLFSLGAPTVANKPVENNCIRVGMPIAGVEWTPNGQKLLVFFYCSPSISVYDTSSGGLVLKNILTMETDVTHIVRSSSEVDTIAVGLSDGKLCFLNGRDLTILDDSFPCNAKKIRSLDWVGSLNTLLAYSKDYKPVEQDFDNHSADESILQLIDMKAPVDKNYHIPEHITQMKTAPSGGHVAIIKDHINKKENLLKPINASDEAHYSLDIYRFHPKEGPSLVGSVKFKSPVKSIGWSHDSARLAVVLDNGELKIFDQSAQMIDQ